MSTPATPPTTPATIFPFDGERRRIHVEVRDAKQKNVVTGYMQLYGSDAINDRNEVFQPGSGAKTLTERVPKGRVKITDDHQWTSEHTHGVVTRASEDSTGAEFEARWSEAPNSQAIKTKLAEGIVDEWSIEFRAIQEEIIQIGPTYVRSIIEYFLNGLSCTPYSSQGEGTTLSVRSALAPGLVPYNDLPLAPLSTAWEPNAARERILAWASRSSAQSRAPQVRRAFLVETRSSGVAGYSMPIADIVNDQLMAVPAAIQSAGRAVLVDTESDPLYVLQLRSHLDRYYDRMRASFGRQDLVAPWRYGALDSLLAEVRSAAAIAAPSDPNAIQGLAQAAQTILAALPQEEREKLGVPVAGPERATTVAAPPPTSVADSSVPAGAPTTKSVQELEEQELELELQLLF